MKKSIFPIFSAAICLLISCRKDNPVTNQPQKDLASDYYVLDITSNKPGPGLVFLKTSSYQQTTEYTCGPSAVITLLRHFDKSGDEMTIAGEMGTSSTCGTTPAQMSNWLNSHGFKASWHVNGSLDSLVGNLKKNIPTLVEWSDWGGHWVLVTGYDTRSTPSTSDDVIIFADPYDRHDDNMDGFTWFNAERFYYMWYDALLFGSVMKRIYITAVPL
ncbi:MAG TPA: C39 family peptidase [Bacteroidales bacterium]|nr:C39 family peptidase [Bacteroidales bacterium]HSA44850.1 C39 family peptidase [Bacteroidales bacterium]